MLPERARFGIVFSSAFFNISARWECTVHLTRLFFPNLNVQSCADLSEHRGIPCRVKPQN